MTIEYNSYDGCYQARCNKCNSLVEISDAEDFDDVRDAINSDNWLGQIKDGKWMDICPDCQ